MLLRSHRHIYIYTCADLVALPPAQPCLLASVRHRCHSRLLPILCLLPSVQATANHIPPSHLKKLTVPLAPLLTTAQMSRWYQHLLQLPTQLLPSLWIFLLASFFVLHKAISCDCAQLSPSPITWYTLCLAQRKEERDGGGWG